MMHITNPILPGFNPDPSFLRVEDDYYIATSTFEWFPGVQIHHSRDLVHWHLLTRPLDRVSQLDMRGINNSCGVWAPALSYHDDMFWLIYTNVQSCRGGSWMNTPNYVVTAESIEGPWSEPTFLNSSGFDPSLFHDDDGKKYIVQMKWDGRQNRNPFFGILLQELHPETKTMIGSPKIIFTGTHLGATEGPFILKKDGWYYLITAEGGTNFHHAVTICRSKNIEGPYDVHPENPILSSRNASNPPLQRTGHGFMQETQNGEWYLTHLCGRPIQDPEKPDDSASFGSGFSILGRETGIQKISWGSDEWPRLAHKGTLAETDVPAPQLPTHPWPKKSCTDTFDGPTLNHHFQTLREPVDESWCSLTARPGFLRLNGRQSLYSNFEQSLVARRIQSFTMTAETCLDYTPTDIQQMAGLIVYYNKSGYYYLRTTLNDTGEKVLGIVQCINDSEYFEHPEAEIKLEDNQKFYLRVTLDTHWYQFYYSLDGDLFCPIGPKLNSTKLSDEAGDVFRFTGTFVGLSSIDITGTKLPADFEYFSYCEQV
ncbi:MAG: glycoside hydrolase family 43 protein [Reichenbachiella sp.]